MEMFVDDVPIIITLSLLVLNVPVAPNVGVRFRIFHPSPLFIRSPT